MRSYALFSLLSLTVMQLSWGKKIDPPFTLSFLTDNGAHLDVDEGACEPIAQAPLGVVPTDLACAGSMLFTETTTEPRLFAIVKGDCGLTYQVSVPDLPPVGHVWFWIDYDTATNTSGLATLQDGPGDVPLVIDTAQPPGGQTSGTLEECKMV